jgi:amidase
MASSVGKSAFTSDAASSLPLISDMTLDDIAAGLDAGKFTSVQLVKVFLARIKEVDETFHSTIEVNPDAVRIAEELDEEIKTKKKRRRQVLTANGVCFRR